eukprot:CAMPEP_0114243234 /NCGR_PEP_ID=MMETSP0058-20121206/10672_1 /TAXON_ID=36894 /ORGANISM="Pyramimonas parkeae, CCMP726" /LENGTH=918 /DNA_ID=CAMNT_0001356043 /DNA_START=298 /DNA_END=3054 /DNA_ORIENTATION=-
MIGDLTGTYMSRHLESCSFPPDELWQFQDRSNPEFYTQFITNNVQCVAEGAPSCTSDVKACEWERCAISQCVDLQYCDQTELLMLGQPSGRIVPREWNATDVVLSPDRVFVSTARELVWALRQSYVQDIQVMESVTLSREDFDSLPAIVTRSVTVKAYSADVHVSIAVDVDEVFDAQTTTAVVLVGDGGVLEFQGLCTRGSLLYLWSSLGSPRNLNTLPTAYLRDIAVMPGGEVWFVNSVIQSTDTGDAATMSFSASLFSVYSKVIVQAASHRSAKDVYNSEMEPDAFQYHDLDSSYVKDLKVPAIFGGVHRFVSTIITRSRSSPCPEQVLAAPPPPPPSGGDASPSPRAPPEAKTSPSSGSAPVLSMLQIIVIFVFVVLIWILMATICVYMRVQKRRRRAREALRDDVSELWTPSLADWVDADQGMIVQALSRFVENAGRDVTISEAFEHVAKQSMKSCLLRSKEAYTLKVCNTTICQYETYSRILRERRTQPEECMPLRITSASTFVDCLREMQGNVAEAEAAGADALMESLVESLTGRTISGSDSMRSVEQYDAEVVIAIGDSAENTQAPDAGGNGCDKPGQGGEAARSSADAEASTSPSRQPGNNEMLFVGDVVTSASHSYVVQRMVSQGSTSLCFVAEDTDSRIQYALKVPIKATAKMRKTLIEEANCMTRLKHPHIVQMVESFTFQGRYIIVLELCQMQDLQLMVNIAKMGVGGLNGGGSLHVDFLGKVVLQLCLAVKHVHEQSFVHRDIKLSNIYLDNMMDVKLGDFGASKFLEGVTHSFAGTPLNMAPEVLLRRPYNLSSDIWSLGVVLYELCTLHTLFDVSNVEALIAAQSGSHVHMMDALEESHSLELSDLVSKLLNTDPDKRPTADEIMNHPFLIRQLQIACKGKEQDMRTLLPHGLLKSIDSSRGR